MHFFTLLSILLFTTVIESATLSESLQLSRLQKSASALQNKNKIARVDTTVIVHVISSSSSHSISTSSLSPSSSQSTPLSSTSTYNSQSSVSSSSSSSTPSPRVSPSSKSQQSVESFQLPSSQCVEGVTYWDAIKSECTNCTVTGPTGAFVSSQCNVHHDTEYECPKGFYLSKEGACKPCSVCASGHGVWRTCRGSRNRVCRQCQPGTFSGVSVGTLGCITCKKCAPNQEMISECDGNRDTVCVDRSSLRSNYSLYFSGELTAAAAAAGKSQEDEEVDVNDQILLNRVQKPELFRWHSQDRRPSAPSHDGSSYVLPVYFTCLVIIVFAGSIYAFVQFRCVTAGGDIRTMKVVDDRKFHQTAVQIQPVLHSTNASAQHLTSTMAFIPHLYPAPFETKNDIQPVSYMHLYPTVPTAPWRIPVASRQRDNAPKLYQNGQSQYKAYYELLYAPYECEQSGSSTTSSSIASTVRTSVLNELETKLGNDLVSWKMLARDMGYDDDQISALEGQEENRKTSVQTVSKLLENWALKQSTDDSKCDESMARDDIEKLLCDAEKGEQLASALVRIGRIDCARLLRSVQNQADSQPTSDDNLTSVTVQQSNE